MRAWLAGRLERQAHKKIAAHLRATMTRSRVVPVQGMFNFRCHENSVEWIRTHPDQGLTLVECIYLDDDQPILHYLVRTREGELQEVTLGWRAEELEYYALRDVQEPRQVYREFNRSLDYWKDFTTPRWLVWLSGLGRVV